MLTYALESIVKVANVDKLTIEQTLILPAQLLSSLLGNQEPRSELLGLHLKETSELVKVHGSVEAEVRLNGGAPHVGLDLVHEDSEVVLNRVDVGLGVLEVWGNGGDELGARCAEELLKDGERLGSTTLELEKLVTVLLTESAVDGVVQTGRLESDADGNESVHLLVLLGDRVVLGALLEVLGPRDVDEDVAEHADGIGVTVLHHVGETNVVVGGEVSSHDTSKHGLLVELDVVKGLESQAEVTKETVDSEKTNDGEVTQHLVEVLVTVLAGNSCGVLSTLHGAELLGDLGSLDEGVQDVKNTVAAPGVGVLAESLALLLVGCLTGNSHSVRGERVELVDELIDNIPSPVVLQRYLLAQSISIYSSRKTNRRGLEIDGALGVQDEVEQAAVRIVALELGLEGGLEVEGLSSLDKSGLDIVGLLGEVQGGGAAEIITILVLNMLLVLGHESLLLDVAVVIDGAGRSHAVLVSSHRVVYRVGVESRVVSLVSSSRHGERGSNFINDAIFLVN